MRDLRGDLAPADEYTMDRIRTALVHEAHRPAPRSRRMWRVVAVPALAAAVAGVLLVAAPWTGTRDEPATAPQRSAAEVLAGAALAAEHGLAVRPDQFVFVESIQVEATCAGGAEGWHCEGEGGESAALTRQVWLSADGRRPGLLNVQPRGSGSGWWTTKLANCPRGVWTISRNGRSIDCDRAPGPGADRSSAPADAAAMEEYLRERPGGDVFTAAADLLRDNYLRPESQVALYQVVGRQPGVTAKDGVVDAAGRRGVSVGVARDGIRVELIFDGTTYKYLGERVLRGEKVVRESAQLRVAIVDRAGQLP
ncbi:CU044_5270 family protein [Phytohabitans houttuyneae]|uniref:Uncharacterized protein n=1 Tax=Phytohabitans houttuyneae TaxID=1076126 RepID=A0A6V8K160_9ACTN|nr:CU044_5270 family protein [Phytohabitans houttuyneae]GFJ78842.1 hypothetical protein Phou_030220 [Phytohabitans houttuyneae]